jgi:hypothetical protein
MTFSWIHSPSGLLKKIRMMAPRAAGETMILETAVDRFLSLVRPHAI